MAAQKFGTRVNGIWNWISAAVVGTADAIPAMDATGRLDVSMMPVGIAAEVTICPASENLAIGNWVNLYNNASALNARKADATSDAKPCDGFVLANVTAPANATVYRLSQTNTGESGLTVAAQYWLATTAGTITTTAPSTAGNIQQPIGKAGSATSIVFDSGDIVKVGA